MNNKLKIHNRVDWRDFALGYLRLASLSCREMIDRKYPDEDFSVESIYIPTIFNLKHGMEVFLKAISIEFFDKESLEQPDYTHNIEEIFQKLKKEVSESRLRSAIEKYKKEEGPLSEDFFPKGASIFDELERLVRKYQNLDFLRNKIGTDYVIRDEDNTALKYPTNSLRIQIDYEKVSKKFKKEDILETQIDCVKLEGILWRLYILIYAEKDSKK